MKELIDTICSWLWSELEGVIAVTVMIMLFVLALVIIYKLGLWKKD